MSISIDKPDPTKYFLFFLTIEFKAGIKFLFLYFTRFLLTAEAIIKPKIIPNNGLVKILAVAINDPVVEIPATAPLLNSF